MAETLRGGHKKLRKFQLVQAPPGVVKIVRSYCAEFTVIKHSVSYGCKMCCTHLCKGVRALRAGAADVHDARPNGGFSNWQ